MRIIFTVTNDLNYDSRMIRICNSLSDAGYNVTLVGTRFKKSAPLQQQNYRQKRIRVNVESVQNVAGSAGERRVFGGLSHCGRPGHGP